MGSEKTEKMPNEALADDEQVAADEQKVTELLDEEIFGRGTFFLNRPGTMRRRRRSSRRDNAELFDAELEELVDFFRRPFRRRRRSSMMPKQLVDKAELVDDDLEELVDPFFLRPFRRRRRSSMMPKQLVDKAELVDDDLEELVDFFRRPF